MNEMKIIILAVVIAILTVLALSKRVRGLIRILYLQFSERQRQGLCILLCSVVLLILGLQTVWKISGFEKDSISTAPIISGDSLRRSLGFMQINTLKNLGVLQIDSNVNITHIRPEIAYVVPSILKAFHAVSRDSVIPQIAFAYNNALVFRTTKTHSTTASGLRLKNILAQRLGASYNVMLKQNTSQISFLKVEYKGSPWNNERLLALPVMNAAIAEKIDPALLMAWVSITSHFDLEFENEQGKRGLLALDSGSGLEQLEVGAHLLRKHLDKHHNVKDALAALYLGEESLRRSEWWKDPLAKAWVEQILLNAQEYRKRGLFLTH